MSNEDNKKNHLGFAKEAADEESKFEEAISGRITK
jgi:hypothetical protein